MSGFSVNINSYDINNLVSFIKTRLFNVFICHMITSRVYKFTRFFFHFMFLSDEGFMFSIPIMYCLLFSYVSLFEHSVLLL